MNIRLTLSTAVLLAGLTGCSDKPKDEPLQLPQYQFEEADFGVGRKHTPNAACNRQIDAWLREVVQCYNTHPKDQCAAMQEKTGERIGRLRNSRRCQR
jgi:hypothetical protein